MTEPAIHCIISDRPIDSVAARRSFAVAPHCGGYVSFEGIVRSSNHGKTVLRLDYEVYYELATLELTRICQSASAEYGLESVAVAHRTGSLEIGDVAVMIQVSGKHRDECFRGCHKIIDELKVSVPIWKHEYYADGTDDWTRCAHHH